MAGVRAEAANRLLAFDVGGTSLRAALYDGQSDTLLATASGRTWSRWNHPEAEPVALLDHLVDDLAGLATRLAGDHRTEGVVVGFPGPIDPAGRALALPTVLGTGLAAAVPVADLLAPAFPDSTIVVVNDVTAAGLAVLDGVETDACVVTVSSGIGIKVFVAGRPVVGRAGRGGEIGHLVVDRDPRANPCECGGRGHLGAVASGRGVLVTARRRAHDDPTGYTRSALGTIAPEDLESTQLVVAFHGGDAWVSALVDEAAGHLGWALAGVHTALGVERFVLVGGFAVALGEPYRRLVAAHAAALCWNLGQNWPSMVELRDLDGNAGLLGAGRYARAVLQGGA